MTISKELIRADFKVVLHATIIPGILAIFFGAWALMYLLVPTAAYLTFAKNKEDERMLFFLIAAIELSILVSGWADAIPA